MVDRTPVDLQLLGQFNLRVAGQHVSVAATGQRLLAGIALSGGVAQRARLAGTLWPENRDTRAYANLRGTLSRLPRVLRSEVVTTPTTLSFTDAWRVDVDSATTAARELRDRVAPAARTRPGDQGDNGGSGDPSACDCLLFAHDLLPDWCEDWLLVQRERHRQLRLHALEDLARMQLDCGDVLTAVDTALQAVTADELRESSQYLLLEAHLAAGNRAAAARQFIRFCEVLREELGVDPSPRTLALVREGGALPRQR
jgi:DNA-binding SARP family transcriptional activator